MSIVGLWTLTILVGAYLYRAVELSACFFPQDPQFLDSVCELEAAKVIMIALNPKP